jgi:hypothetical protein
LRSGGTDCVGTGRLLRSEHNDPAPAAGVSGAPGGANAATIAAPVPSAVSPAAPVTVQKARADCWMDLENNKKAPQDLEQRNKVVEQCVTAKMNGQAAR